MAVVFIITISTTDTSNCDTCSLIADGEEVNVKQFMEYYYDECLTYEKSGDLINFDSHT